MKAQTAQRIVSVVLPLLVAMMNTRLAGAQVRPIVRDTTGQRSGATPAPAGMQGMMAGPHHALAMAYGENLATFARAVHADASRSNMVSTELARPATAEMRRSFDQMKAHHQAQMSTVGTTMRMPMAKDSAAAMMRPARPDAMAPKPMPTPPRADSMQPMKMGDMQTQMTAIESHLGMLETEVRGSSPNAAKVAEHAAEILKLCESRMRSPADSAGKMGRPGAR